MPSQRKILAQVVGDAAGIATWVPLYQVPEGVTAGDPEAGRGMFDTVLSSLVICNQAGTAATFSIAVADGSVNLDDVPPARCVLHSAQSLAANTTIYLLKGVTLAVGSYIKVAASAATVSFSAFGQENYF